MLNRFHTLSERDGQTDGRTDRQNSYINIARQRCCADGSTRDKNGKNLYRTIRKRI